MLLGRKATNQQTMVGLKKKKKKKPGHIRKNLPQNGEPQSFSWGTQKKQKKNPGSAVVEADALPLGQPGGGERQACSECCGKEHHLRAGVTFHATWLQLSTRQYITVSACAGVKFARAVSCNHEERRVCSKSCRKQHRMAMLHKSYTWPCHLFHGRNITSLMC